MREIYLERGHPVTVITRWGKGGGPRNVAIRRPDGQVVVRPFRGLRRTPSERQVPLGFGVRRAQSARALLGEEKPDGR